MLTVNELFSGIGSQRAALERLGIEHKVVGIAEIDKFAIKSYKAIWGCKQRSSTPNGKGNSCSLRG